MKAGRHLGAIVGAAETNRLGKLADMSRLALHAEGRSQTHSTTRA